MLYLWLCRRPVATAPINPLAWEPPYATCVALKSKKKKKEVDSSLLSLPSPPPGEHRLTQQFSYFFGFVLRLLTGTIWGFRGRRGEGRQQLIDLSSFVIYY